MAPMAFLLQAPPSSGEGKRASGGAGRRIDLLTGQLESSRQCPLSTGLAPAAQDGLQHCSPNCTAALIIWVCGSPSREDRGMDSAAISWPSRGRQAAGHPKCAHICRIASCGSLPYLYVQASPAGATASCILVQLQHSPQQPACWCTFNTRVSPSQLAHGKRSSLRTLLMVAKPLASRYIASKGQRLTSKGVQQAGAHANVSDLAHQLDQQHQLHTVVLDYRSVSCTVGRRATVQCSAQQCVV